MSEFRLHLAGGDGVTRIALWRPLLSDLRWEATGKPVSLSAVNMSHAPGKTFAKAFPVSPINPAGKSRDVGTLKIQLGLKCNYTCQYCSQAHQPHDTQGNLDDVDDFLANLHTWLKGKPSRVEFWGGEPFAYWKTLKPLAEGLRKVLPDSRFSLVTNGSLLDEEKNAWLDQMGFNVAISHDGPAMKYRGPDPLQNAGQLAAIRDLYARLRPASRIGFNAVLHRRNTDMGAIRDFIADKLDVPADELPIGTEEIMLPYDDAGMRLSLRSEADKRAYLEAIFWQLVKGDTPGMQFYTLRDKIGGLFNKIATRQPAESLGQKCGMDNPHRLAVDLKGNALTCQNMSADTKHRIGSIEAFEDIRLDTAYHWSVREECRNCPVLTMCQGACLFLEGDLWKQACDNSFTHNIAVLAAAMYWLTGYILSEVEGPARRGGEPMKLQVIDPAKVAA